MRVTVGLERLSLCPHQYELVEGATGSGGWSTHPGAAYLGSCIHRALELYFNARLAGETPDLAFLQAMYSEAWITGQPLSDGMTHAQIDWRGDDTAELAHADGLGMLAVYWPIASQLIPAHTEYQWQVDYPYEFMLPESRTVISGIEPLEGHIDLITADGCLIDFKTGKRRKSQIEVDTSLQLSVYAWALRQTGVWTRQHERVEIHSITRGKRMLKRGKNIVPNPEPYKTAIVQSRRNLINYEWIDEIFLPRLIAMKRTGSFPASPGTHCSMCPAREACGHWESIMQGRDDIALDDFDIDDD